MNLVPFTYNGGTLRDGVNTDAVLQTEGQVIPATDIIEVERTNNFPDYAGKEFKSKLLPITIEFLGTATTRDNINEILDTTDTSEHQFICKDTSNADKQWYVNAVVKSQPDFGPNHAEYILYAADPMWKAVTGGSVSWSGTSSPGTISGTVEGNRNSYPTIYITPTGAKAGGYAYKRFVEVVNPLTDTAFTSYPINVVDNGSGTATWDSGTLVAGGTISSASGYDVRVSVDNTEVERWFGNFNTATTSVWSNISLKPKIELTINDALGTTSVSEIAFDKTPKKTKSKNLAALKKLKATGVLKTPGGEYIAYDDVVVNGYKVTGITRATRGSTVGTVAAGGTLTYIEHDVYLMYGNAAAIDPAQDNNAQPAISLTDSSNISHKWDVFGEVDGLRSLSWFPALVASRGGESYTYGGNEGTIDTDPFTDMGMAIIGYTYGNRAQAEKARLTWDLYHPAGGSVAIYNGEKYQATNSYPKYSRLQKSVTGKKYTTDVEIATPTSYGTWEAFSGTSALGADYHRFRWEFYGGLSAISDNAAYFEIGDFTLSLDTDSVPVVTMKAEEGNYNLDMTISNSTTGQSIDIDYLMSLNETLIIDCANNNAYKQDDGTPASSAVFPDTARDFWLSLDPGVNEIVVTETGLAGMTVVITWDEQKL